jgi:hypothetical protein
VNGSHAAQYTGGLASAVLGISADVFNRSRIKTVSVAAITPNLRLGE